MYFRFSFVPTLVLFLYFQSFSFPFYFSSSNINVLTFTSANTINTNANTDCSPDYHDSEHSHIVRLCPKKTVHVVNEDSGNNILIGTFDSDASTDNTQFYRNGDDCKAERGSTYSSELVFTCCAPYHDDRENHLNSVMQVAPCYFILEACASHACNSAMLERVTAEAAEEEVSEDTDQNEDSVVGSEEGGEREREDEMDTRTRENNDQSLLSTVNTDVNDALNQLLGRTGISATVISGNTNNGGAGDVGGDAGGDVGGDVGGASAGQVDSIMSAIKESFAGLGGIGGNLNTIGSFVQMSIENVQKAGATAGENDDGTYNNDKPKVQIIQLDGTALQSLFKNGKVGNELGNAALAALNSGGKGKKKDGSSSNSVDNVQLLEQIQAALLGNKENIQKLIQDSLLQVQGSTASREGAARKKNVKKRKRNVQTNQDDYESPLPIMSTNEQNQLRLSVSDMFHQSYDSYMKHAFPWDEILPMNCDGTSSPLTGGGSLTLIDLLDTLVIMGNYSEFVKSVWNAVDHVNFNVNLNVSVFETTIRVLGGLLSGHILSMGLDVSGDDDHVHTQIQNEFQKYSELHTNRGLYNGELLQLAIDVADRMLPAFDTVTGIPIGTVNLKHGIPVGETDVASTAGGGSLYMEFGMLSSLTGNATYALKSRNALIALYNKHHAKTGLVGMHINTKTGKWTEKLSGIGSNIDSFYEYLYKSYVLFGDGEVYQMFNHMYDSVMIHLRDGPWYANTDMSSGKKLRKMYNNLQAFWPGLQVLIGDALPATDTMRAFHLVRQSMDFTPEHFNYRTWKLKKSGSGYNTYPLRPELIESTYMMHEYSKNNNRYSGVSSSWLWAGKEMINSINRTKVKCGFATVSDVGTGQLEDQMPSFFLSETLKYLYLLFDSNNPFNSRHNGTGGRNYMFTTEAHIFPIHLRGVKHDVSFRLPPTFYGNDEDYSNKKHRFRRGMWENHQCKKLPWWKDLYELPYLSNMAENTQAVTGVSPFDSVVIRKGEGGKSIHESGNGDDGGTMRINVKGVGEFDVTPFHGGFSVHNQLDGVFLEVSSLGVNPIVAYMSRPVEMFKDTALTKGKTIKVTLEDFKSGGQKIREEVEEEVDEEENNEEEELHSITRFVYYDGTIRDCEVTLDTSDSSGGGSRSRDSSINGVDEYPFTLPCSPASFGLMKPFDKVNGKLKIMKNITHPKDPFVGCTSYNVTENTQDKYIIHVSRGICSFEQKVWYAERAGAIGIVIGLVNEKDTIFVMAGAGDAFEPPVEITSGDSGGVEEKRRNGDHGTTIPAVMINYDYSQLIQSMDGALVELRDTEPDASIARSAITSSTNKDTETTASSLLNVVVESAKDSTIEKNGAGGDEAPSKIKLIGPSGWGIVLSLHKSVEWQLGIISGGTEVELN